MKSLVPKRYKSIFINLSKNVFSLPRNKKVAKWKPVFSVSNFHIASLGYDKIKKYNYLIII